MNASKLADMLERQSSLSEAEQEQCADILRRQHEAIKQLRAALKRIERLGNKMDFSAVAEAKAALKAFADTEGL